MGMGSVEKATSYAEDPEVGPWAEVEVLVVPVADLQAARRIAADWGRASRPCSKEYRDATLASAAQSQECRSMPGCDHDSLQAQLMLEAYYRWRQHEEEEAASLAEVGRSHHTRHRSVQLA